MSDFLGAFGRKPAADDSLIPLSAVVGAFLGETAPENPLILLNSLFPEDCTDSEDLADQIDEFFDFMIWTA